MGMHAGCATSPAEGTASDNLSAFVLTVNADETNITVTANGANTVCTAFSTCNIPYLAGTSLSIKAGAQNLADCLRWSSWTDSCAGKANPCVEVINSNLIVGANYAVIRGCIPR
jgi:hypothetical protein